MGVDHDTSSRETASAAGPLLAWLSNARGKVTDASEHANRATEHASRGAVTYIVRFPYETVAMAVALGFLVGMLWSRR
ncbi:MAG TPA: hypothetical protein VLN59_13740 [Burkholderiales bacterium]|nr:hypothetical protein [Burkholderiales bacterium]